MKLGGLKAAKYFNLLARYLSLKINKSEFDGLCVGIVGKENIRLHNLLLRSIIRNATLSRAPPSKENKVDGSLSVKSLSKDICRGRTQNLRNRKCKDRFSPLGPNGKSYSAVCDDAFPKIQEQQSATELLSLGSRPPGSVEDGEEVDQAAGSPGIHSRSPVTAPLGISLNSKAIRKVPIIGFSSSCHSRGELPDTSFLKKRMEQKLAMEGLKISVDCANLMNNSLDVFLKRLIKPILEKASSRSGSLPSGRYAQDLRGLVSASMLDFRVAMELNPRILGEDWPTHMEKICQRASEEVIRTD